MVAGTIGSIFLMLIALGCAFLSGMCLNSDKIAAISVAFAAISVAFGALALICLIWFPPSASRGSDRKSPLAR